MPAFSDALQYRLIVEGSVPLYMKSNVNLRSTETKVLGIQLGAIIALAFLIHHKICRSTETG